MVEQSCTTARVVIHPPIDLGLRAFCRGDVQVAAKDYLWRNHDIVRASDMLVAALKTEEVSRPGDISLNAF